MKTAIHWVTTVTHKCGVDTTLHASEAGVFATIQDIMEEWMEDWEKDDDFEDEDLADVRALIAGGDIAEAWNVFKEDKGFAPDICVWWGFEELEISPS